MEIKRSGKYIYGANLTSAERKALDIEIQKSLAEYNRKHELEIEALVIRQVRRRLGLGEKRLHEFYNSFADDLDGLTNHYDMGEEDQAWLCVQELKEEGFDIEQWHKEKWPNEKYE